jgi:hypothetical protein
LNMLVKMDGRDLKGGRGSAWACPVARAIGRAFGGEAAATTFRVLVSVPGRPYLVGNLPTKARRWLILYDHDKIRRDRRRPELKPISFHLAVAG